jgi:hypothetical protein
VARHSSSTTILKRFGWAVIGSGWRRVFSVHPRGHAHAIQILLLLSAFADCLQKDGDRRHFTGLAAAVIFVAVIVSPFTSPVSCTSSPACEAMVFEL